MDVRGELRLRGIPVTQQDEYEITYKGQFVIYGNACWRELRLCGLDARPGRRMQVAYKGVVIGDVAFRHIIVEGRVMLFPVAIRDVSDNHLDDLKRWMQLCGIELGILANFDAVRLGPKFIRAREEQDEKS